jgi:hypothetical protein
MTDLTPAAPTVTPPLANLPANTGSKAAKELTEALFAVITSELKGEPAPPAQSDRVQVVLSTSAGEVLAGPVQACIGVTFGALSRLGGSGGAEAPHIGAPEWLSGTESLKLLRQLLQALVQQDPSVRDRGWEFLSYAMQGWYAPSLYLGAPDPLVKPGPSSLLCPLLAFLADQILRDEFKFRNCYAQELTYGSARLTPPMVVAARNGDLECAQFLQGRGHVIQSGQGPPTFDPGYIAFYWGHPHVFELLCSTGYDASVCYQVGGCGARIPVIFLMIQSFSLMSEDDLSDVSSLPERREKILRLCFTRQPELANLYYEDHSATYRRGCLIDSAVYGGMKAIEIALEYGSSLEFKYVQREESGRVFIERTPTVVTVLNALPLAAAVEIIDRYGLLVREPYDEPSLNSVAAVALVYSTSSIFAPEEAAREEAFGKLKLLFDAGFADYATEGVLLGDAVRDKESTEADSSVLDSDQESRLLRAMRVAKKGYPPCEPFSGLANTTALLIMAIRSGLSRVVTFLLKERGMDANCAYLGVSPLACALQVQQYQIARDLIASHGAKVTPADCEQERLPLSFLISNTSDETEPAAVEVLDEMLKQEPDMLLRWLFAKKGPASSCAGPFHHAVLNGRRKILEKLLLGSSQEAITKTIETGLNADSYFCTATQLAALVDDWNALYLLLRYCPTASVTSTTATAEDGSILKTDLPSVATICAERNCRDRRVLAVVDTIRKREKAAADRAKAASAEAEKKKRGDGAAATAVQEAVPPPDATGTSTTAFEDPSLKAISVKEAKEKERKKAQKKKARAKKRAEAKANGGAGKKEDEDSSDSGEDSAEEGMDEEEKMMHRAPAFDLEMTKRDRAEAAAKQLLEKK